MFTFRRNFNKGYSLSNRRSPNVLTTARLLPSYRGQTLPPVGLSSYHYLNNPQDAHNNTPKFSNASRDVSNIALHNNFFNISKGGFDNLDKNALQELVIFIVGLLIFFWTLYRKKSLNEINKEIDGYWQEISNLLSQFHIRHTFSIDNIETNDFLLKDEELILSIKKIEIYCQLNQDLRKRLDRFWGNPFDSKEREVLSGDIAFQSLILKAAYGIQKAAVCYNQQNYDAGLEAINVFIHDVEEYSSWLQRQELITPLKIYNFELQWDGVILNHFLFLTSLLLTVYKRQAQLFLHRGITSVAIKPWSPGNGDFHQAKEVDEKIKQLYSKLESLINPKFKR